MASKKLNPMERISAKYAVGVGTTPGFIRNRAWANTQKAYEEDSLAPEQLRLLDALTATYCVTDPDTSHRLSIYAAFALQVRLLDDAAATIWADGVEAAIPGFAALWATPGFDPANSEDDADACEGASDYYDRFGHTMNIDDLSAEEKAVVLENYAVLISAGLEAVGTAFAFFEDEVAAEMLRESDCNPFGDKLGDDERAEAVAVFKLAAAWPVEGSEERLALAELAAERPEDADRAVAIIGEHSPATVAELVGLLDGAPVA